MDTSAIAATRALGNCWRRHRPADLMQRYFRLQNLHEFLAFLPEELKRTPLPGCNASSPQLRCFSPLLHHP